MATQVDYDSQLITLKRIETALDLERRGYKTSVEERIDDVQADLVARKGQRTIVYEFKLAGKSLRTDSAQIRRLRALAADNGFEFRLIVVSPPHKPTIELENLDSILFDVLINRHQPDELYELASAVQIEDVCDAEISKLEIQKDVIEVSGNATVEVRLEYGGGEARDGLTSEDSFPFSFAIKLDHELNVVEIDRVEVDTSSFYK